MCLGTSVCDRCNKVIRDLKEQLAAAHKENEDLKWTIQSLTQQVEDAMQRADYIETMSDPQCYKGW